MRYPNNNNNNNNNQNPNTIYHFQRLHSPAPLLRPAVRRSIECKVPRSVKSPETLRRLPSRQPLCQTRHVGPASIHGVPPPQLQRRDCLSSALPNETAAGGRRSSGQVRRCGTPLPLAKRRDFTERRSPTRQLSFRSKMGFGDERETASSKQGDFLVGPKLQLCERCH